MWRCGRGRMIAVRENKYETPDQKAKMFATSVLLEKHASKRKLKKTRKTGCLTTPNFGI